MRLEELRVRAVRASDLERLVGFRCSTGEPWEELVETQIRGPLPRRYLAAPPRFDGRMLVVMGQDDALLAVGAHRIEPTLVPDVGYTEVIAVALPARGTRVELPGGRQPTLGEFLLLTIFRQMRTLGRHRRTFVRVDRRNLRSLALCGPSGSARSELIPRIARSSNAGASCRSPLPLAQ